jgi:Ca-activated chloride channel family protein
VTFERPWWLAVGVFVCAALIGLWVLHDRRQSAALTRFVSVTLRAELTRSVSVAKRRLQRGLFVAALALLFVALAGPLLGFRWENISRRGNEIVFAIDTSRSMDTPDMKPSRLTRAKLAIDDFADRLDGDAVGIVAFAGTAFLVCPITLDYGAFHESLNALDTSTIPRGGTNLSSAIQEADAALRRRPGSDKILILVTDGEDLEGSAVDAARAAAHDDGLKIYTVGVGSASGDLIPIPPAQGGGFVKDESGAYVKSRLDETTLKAIAVATGGFYVPLGTQGEGLETIYTRVLGPLAKHDLASRQQKIYTQRYQWPLTASLLALLLSLLIGNRRGAARRLRTPGVAASGVTILPWLSLSSLALASLASLAAAPSARADVPGTAEFNAGTAAYKAGQFPQAAQAFQQSISHAPSGDAKRLATQEDAYYNLGNTLYRAGQTTEKSSPQETLKKWNDAVKAYETALQLRADDADSKFNRDFVKRKIAQLKQDQDQNKDQGKDPSKDQNKGQGQGQGQGQGNGQGQNQNQNPPQNPPGGQPPPNSQAAHNNPPKPGDAPPPKPGDAKNQQPPQSAGQKPGAPANGSPQPQSPSGTPDQQADREAREADNQRVPGQMSKEEARELLDSVKGDEKHPMGAPLARRDTDDDTPDKPFKNW